MTEVEIWESTHVPVPETHEAHGVKLYMCCMPGCHIECSTGTEFYKRPMCWRCYANCVAVNEQDEGFKRVSIYSHHPLRFLCVRRHTYTINGGYQDAKSGKFEWTEDRPLHQGI